MWKHIGSALVLIGGLSASLLPASFASAQEGRGDRVAGVEGAAERGDPFLWRVEGDGTTAFLFGTVHLPDERVLALDPVVEEAFEASTAFYAEIEATKESTAEVQRRALLPSSRSLPDVIGQELWERVEGELRAAGLGAFALPGMKRLKPWAIGAMLPTLEYLTAQSEGIEPLDARLFERALEEGKPAAGLETVAEQISVFEAFSEEEQVRMLAHTLDQMAADRREGVSTIEATVRAWLSGDEEKLLDVLEESFAVDPEFRERIEDKLIWERNVRFAERIDRVISTEPDSVPFFAVGALHMPDPRVPEDGDGSGADAAAGDGDAAEEPVREGLVSLLRARGYTVTRVRSAVPAGAGR